MYDEQALTKYFRLMFAKDLKQERKEFRKGYKQIYEKRRSAILRYEFITVEKFVHYRKANFSWCDLKEHIDTIKPIESKYFGDLIVVFDTEVVEGTYCGATECCGNCEERVPVVEAVQWYVKMKTLDKVKVNFKSGLKHFLSDAKWKIEKQPNGKDANFYLKIIEKVNAKTN